MLKIISAEERLAKKSAIKGVIFGKHGIGKTSLLRTLDSARTLFVNAEAGELAVQAFDGPSTDPIRRWEDARDIACLIGGANPAMRPDQPYSQAHYDYLAEQHRATLELLRGIDNIFVDSLTDFSRQAFQWCKGQPDAFSKKKVDAAGSPVPDTQGAYGLLKQEMITWCRHWQHTPEKNVWLLGGLNEKEDDYGRKQWLPQVEGTGTASELPGIVDQVISMVEMRTEDGTPYRAFVCHMLNPQGYPAKDRSGCLDMIEEPHLGRLMAKIKGGARQDQQMVTGLPT